MTKLRLLLAATLTGAALLLSGPGWAASGYGNWDFKFTSTGHDIRLQLQLFVKNDGTAKVTGFLYTGTQRLTPGASEPAQASCADLDDDGVAGLTRLVGTFSPAGQTREHVLLAIVPDREVDEPETYPISINEVETGRTLFNGPVRVDLGPSTPNQGCALP